MIRIHTFIKKLTYETVLSILFVFLIFVIGFVSVRPVLQIADNFFGVDQPLSKRIWEAASKINNHYKDMLEFKGNSVVNKTTYINMNGFIAGVLGSRVVNKMVKLNNGHLEQLFPKWDTDDPYAAGVKRLKDYCDEQNVPLLYVQAPWKICKYNKELPPGEEDYSNENLDNFLKKLRAFNIDVLDLREEMHGEGLNHYDAFFKTDHHWTPETGLWASAKVQEYLMGKGIVETETIDTRLQDINNFNKDIYKDIFIGSRARRTGIYFAGTIDDISLIYPKFDTHIIVESPAHNVRKEGSFQEVMFNFDYLQTGFEMNTYEVYAAYGAGYTHYINKAAKSRKKIVFESDSFGIVVAPFLSLAFEDTFSGINTRHKLPDIIIEEKPDVVILLIYNIAFLDEIVIPPQK
jgi:hypothetical protein